MSTCPLSNMIFWTLGLVRSLDKLKLLNLHYHSVYGYQTWRYGNFLWWAPTFKFKRLFDHMILQDRATNYIFIIKVPMATRLGRMVTYLRRLLPIKSHDPLNTWSCKIAWQTKIIISPLPQSLRPLNLTVWQLTFTGYCL